VLEREYKNDLRSKRTRRLLQTALSELMTEKRFHEISVQDITAKAEVNRATFYAHFDDKYQLLNMLIHDSFQSLLREQLPERPLFTVSNLRILSLATHQYLTGFDTHCSRAAFKTDESLMMQQVHREIFNTILDWMRRTPMQSSHDNMDFAATVVSWALFGANIELGMTKTASPEQFTDQVLALLEPSLREYLLAEAVH
jgi:AcrR family transcriptional regulator